MATLERRPFRFPANPSRVRSHPWAGPAEKPRPGLDPAQEAGLTPLEYASLLERMRFDLLLEITGRLRPQPCPSGGASSASGTDFYGDGSDGDVILYANTTLTRDMFYTHLTLATGVTLYPNGFQIYVRKQLTLSSGAAILASGGAGGAGSGATGGAAGRGRRRLRAGRSCRAQAGGAGGSSGGSGTATGTAGAGHRREPARALRPDDVPAGCGGGAGPGSALPAARSRRPRATPRWARTAPRAGRRRSAAARPAWGRRRRRRRRGDRGLRPHRGERRRDPRQWRSRRQRTDQRRAQIGQRRRAAAAR